MRFSALLTFLAPFSTATDGRAASLSQRNADAFPIPASQGSVTYSSPKLISGTFDGGMKTYGRGFACTGQVEGGNDDAVFLLADGATLKNAIIGKDQSEGVHCLGSCTIENVWWPEVCEDALTFKGNGDGKVIGGGARNAEDKVIQHNGIGSVLISGFTVENFGKLYRSCGNCKENGDARRVAIENVRATNGEALVGINLNYGDKAQVSSSCIQSVTAVCVEFTGITNPRREPTQIATGPSKACPYTTVDVDQC